MKSSANYLLAMMAACVTAVIILYLTGNIPQLFKGYEKNPSEKFQETMMEFVRVVRNQQTASVGAKNMLYLAILKAEENFNTASVSSVRRTFRTQTEYLEHVPTILLQFSEGAVQTMESYRIHHPEQVHVFRANAVKDLTESIVAHYPR